MAEGFLLDIQGVNTGFVSNKMITPTFAYYQENTLVSVPNAQSMSYDPKTGFGDNGGGSVHLSDFSPHLEGLTSGDSTLVSVEYDEASTSAITVDDTSSFPVSGNIWIGQECIKYSGKSATQLGTVSITRGHLQTKAETHEVARFVYGHNPMIQGRKCWMYRVDLSDVSVKTLIYVGYIDSIEQDSEGYVLSILSGKILIEDAEAFATPFASGKVRSVKSLSDKIKKTHDALYFELASKDRGFETTGAYVKYLQVNDELMEVLQVVYPAVSANVAVVPIAADEVEVTVTSGNGGFEAGDYVDFVDSSGDIIEEGVFVLNVTSSGNNQILEHTGQTTSLTTSDQVLANYKQVLTVDRGKNNTVIEEHDDKSDASEVRSWGISGKKTIFDLLMEVLVSRYGDSQNDFAPAGRGTFDKLPFNWGLGLSLINDIDLLSFQQAENLASPRTYWLKEPLPVKDLLRWFAQSTNSAVFWSYEGKLTCRPRSGIYPFDDGLKTISTANVVNIPSVRLDRSQVINIVKIKADYTLDGEPFFTETIVHEESVLRYGKHELENFDDFGIKMVNGISEMTAVFESLLAISAYPTPIVTVEVAYNKDITYEPAELVNFTFPNLFNGQGATGFNNDIFEILEVNPSIGQGQDTVMLTIKRRPAEPDTCRINIAGIVESVAGSDVTLKASSLTHLSPTNPLVENGFELDNSGYIGQNDIEWFKQNDSLKLIDVSTIGSANTVASSGITSINYATNTMTLSSVPGWLAAGDWVRLDQYTTVKTGGVSERIGFFAWLSDLSSPPVLGSGDSSSKWGS